MLGYHSVNWHKISNLEQKIKGFGGTCFLSQDHALYKPFAINSRMVNYEGNVEEALFIVCAVCSSECGECFLFDSKKFWINLMVFPKWILLIKWEKELKTAAATPANGCNKRMNKVGYKLKTRFEIFETEKNT